MNQLCTQTSNTTPRFFHARTKERLLLLLVFGENRREPRRDPRRIQVLESCEHQQVVCFHVFQEQSFSRSPYYPCLHAVKLLRKQSSKIFVRFFAERRMDGHKPQTLLPLFLPSSD